MPYAFKIIWQPMETNKQNYINSLFLLISFHVFAEKPNKTKTEI